jgi:hypothetical protein
VDGRRRRLVARGEKGVFGFVLADAGRKGLGGIPMTTRTIANIAESAPVSMSDRRDEQGEKQAEVWKRRR